MNDTHPGFLRLLLFASEHLDFGFLSPIFSVPSLHFTMSLAGVQNVLCQAEKEVSGLEIEHNIELETEDQCEETWNQMEDSRGTRGPIAESEMDIQARTADGLEDLIRGLSIEVAMGTDSCYRRLVDIFLQLRIPEDYASNRYMHNFDIWLHNNNYVPAGASIFEDSLPEGTPLLIIAWIMSQ